VPKIQIVKERAAVFHGVSARVTAPIIAIDEATATTIFGRARELNH